MEMWDVAVDEPGRGETVVAATSIGIGYSCFALIFVTKGEDCFSGPSTELLSMRVLLLQLMAQDGIAEGTFWISQLISCSIAHVVLIRVYYFPAAAP